MSTYTVEQVQKLPSDLLTKLKRHLQDVGLGDFVHRGPLKPDEWKKIAQLLSKKPSHFTDATGYSLDAVLSGKRGISVSEAKKQMVSNMVLSLLLAVSVLAVSVLALSVLAVSVLAVSAHAYLTCVVAFSARRGTRDKTR